MKNKLLILGAASLLAIGGGLTFALLNKAQQFKSANAIDKSISFDAAFVKTNEETKDNFDQYYYSSPFEKRITAPGNSGIDIKVYARGKANSSPGTERTNSGFAFGETFDGNGSFLCGYQDSVYDAQLIIEVGVNNLTSFNFDVALGNQFESDTTSNLFTLTATYFDENGDQIGSTYINDLHPYGGRTASGIFIDPAQVNNKIIRKVIFVLDANNYVSPNEPIIIYALGLNWSC